MGGPPPAVRVLRWYAVAGHARQREDRGHPASECPRTEADGWLLQLRLRCFMSTSRISAGPDAGSNSGRTTRTSRTGPGESHLFLIQIRVHPWTLDQTSRTRGTNHAREVANSVITGETTQLALARISYAGRRTRVAPDRSRRYGEVGQAITDATQDIPPVTIAVPARAASTE